jgi:uncharacterized membrane protein required for colicin V production
MGFVYKAGNLIGLILGIWVASRYMPVVSGWFGGGVGASISAFFILLSLTSKLFSIIAWLIDKAFSIVRIIPFVTTFNRVLGAVLSVGITAIFLSVMLYVFQSLPISTEAQKTVTESSVAQSLISLSIFYKPILSHKLLDYVKL